MWSNVNKPVLTTYTNVNALGREQYDDPQITYDSASAFYDGVDVNMWFDVLKPAGNLSINAGMISALVMPVTYSRNVNSGDNWTKVPKAT